MVVIGFWWFGNADNRGRCWNYSVHEDILCPDSVRKVWLCALCLVRKVELCAYYSKKNNVRTIDVAFLLSCYRPRYENYYFIHFDSFKRELDLWIIGFGETSGI